MHQLGYIDTILSAYSEKAWSTFASLSRDKYGMSRSAPTVDDSYALVVEGLVKTGLG